MVTGLCENPDSSVQPGWTRKQSFGSAVVRSRALLTVWLRSDWLSPIFIPLQVEVNPPKPLRIYGTTCALRQPPSDHPRSEPAVRLTQPNACSLTRCATAACFRSVAWPRSRVLSLCRDAKNSLQSVTRRPGELGTSIAHKWISVTPLRPQSSAALPADARAYQTEPTQWRARSSRHQHS